MRLKKKTASMLSLQVASLLHNDIGLLTHSIYDFGKGKWSLHLSYCDVQHEPKGMRGEFGASSTRKPHTLPTGMERVSSELEYDHELPSTFKGIHVRDCKRYYTLAYWTREKPGLLSCFALLSKSSSMKWKFFSGFTAGAAVEKIECASKVFYQQGNPAVTHLYGCNKIFFCEKMLS